MKTRVRKDLKTTRKQELIDKLAAQNSQGVGGSWCVCISNIDPRP